jgi:hypothetical protein
MMGSGRKGKEGSRDNATPKDWRKGCNGEGERERAREDARKPKPKRWAEDEWTTGTAREDLKNDMRRVD